MFTIEIPDHNDNLVEVELDEEIFFLHFSWNETAQYWTLSIENAYNDELISCLPLLPHRALIQPVRNNELPLGELITIREDDHATIGRADFKNGTAQLVYVSVDDEL